MTRIATHCASCILGAVFASTIFAAWIVPVVRDNWWAQGRNDGRLDAYSEVHRKIASRFGVVTIYPSDESELFSFKTSYVVVVNENGVKTIRASLD